MLVLDGLVPNGVAPPAALAAPALGATYPAFPANADAVGRNQNQSDQLNQVPFLGTLTHAEILQMMLFYNEDFGILANDTASTRREKVRHWLSQ